MHGTKRALIQVVYCVCCHFEEALQPRISLTVAKKKGGGGGGGGGLQG